MAIDTQTRKRRASPWRILKPVQSQVRLAMAISACSALFGLAVMLQLMMVIQRLLTDPNTVPWLWFGGAAVCTVAAYVARLGAFNQAHYAAFRLERILRIGLAERLAHVSLGYVETQGAGALAKVIHDDVKALHVFVADSTPLYARAYVTPVVTLGLLIALDWRLALVTLTVLVLGYGILTRAQKRRRDMVRKYNAARERVSAAVVEYVQAMPVVRNFDSGKMSFGRYQDALDGYLTVMLDWYRAAGFPARFSWLVLSPMPTLTLVLGMGLWLTAMGDMSVSRWLGVLLICTGMAEAMMPMMMLRHMIEKVSLSVARIEEVMNAPELEQTALAQAGTPLSLNPSAPALQFEDVTFSYGADLEPALRDISFSVAEGTVTALVGPSGAGKTTIARLIPRFWDVTSGRISLGGHDIRDMSPDQLMEHVAFVFQESFLFAESIAANIRIGKPDASDEDVIAAATAAQAHGFICDLPQGYDTPVGERGVFLSGGQRQRIAIARALLQSRPILVLDEATAFADPENEAELIAALSALMRGRTVIMVAHRLATIRDADQILVFDRGQIAERGVHDDLVVQGGVYARLWRNYEQAQNWSLGGARTPSEPAQEMVK
ncbi:ABC transporter ATP-binding protein/permease [Loktanella sp. D2R18]|uniref:ABC transporter ATP-binding protein n=1 Tax=Rhodobacterales TaxID=204455 RepID=UPI000DEB8B66|nr:MULTISPECIES: ABC transporter ATP-binding protein [Rhodobacterales]MDO6592014.1 ABC transporter ATP-binding protein [Yoonia sp. 1_MG-2023]RBW44974.1 ABC transporter ATP-binding protein/permease [Loktanella sp. D2R18]